MPDYRRIAGVKAGKIFKQRLEQDRLEVESDKKFAEKARKKLGSVNENENI